MSSCMTHLAVVVGDGVDEVLLVGRGHPPQRAAQQVPRHERRHAEALPRACPARNACLRAAVNPGVLPNTAHLLPDKPAVSASANHVLHLETLVSLGNSKHSYPRGYVRGEGRCCSAALVRPLHGKSLHWFEVWMEQCWLKGSPSLVYPCTPDETLLAWVAWLGALAGAHPLAAVPCNTPLRNHALPLLHGPRAEVGMRWCQICILVTISRLK